MWPNLLGHNLDFMASINLATILTQTGTCASDQNGLSFQRVCIGNSQESQTSAQAYKRKGQDQMFENLRIHTSEN